MKRLGIIGTGLIAHTNVRAIQALERVEIVALCNRTEQKARDFAAEFSLEVPVYTDYRAMIENERLDMVLINTPHAQHAQQFIDCARRGLDILIEKPLGTTAEECSQMCEARKSAGVRAAVCHTQRYLPPMLLARKICAERREELGALKHISDVINLHYFHDQRPKWFFDPAQAGGGMLLTHGAHQLDRVHLLCGHASERVFAHFESLPQYPGLDSGYQIMGHAGETSYCVTCAGYPSPHTSDVQLDFERGSLHIAQFANGVEDAGVWLGDQNGYRLLQNPFADADAYQEQFSALLDALEGKPSDAPTLEEATAVLRALDAAKRSAASGNAENA